VRLVRQNDLVVEARYRPSKATRISHLAGRMNQEEKTLARDLLAGKIEPEALTAAEISTAGQIRVLDVAAETVEFRYFRREMDKEEYRHRYLTLLQARSRLGLADPADANIPVPGRPDHGHGSNRFSLAAGWQENDFFFETRIRPAYHNLMDADAGYLAGSQIVVLVNIVSLSPRHAFFKPVSWKVDTGFIRRSYDDGDDHLAYRLNPGGGFAWGGARQIAYALFETDAQLGGRFRDGYALGFGGSTSPTDGRRICAAARSITCSATRTGTTRLS